VKLNSDSHNIENIKFYFEEALSLLKDIGYTTQRVLHDGIWQDIEI
jgi:histidinol-phosphatase (PHP family)